MKANELMVDDWILGGNNPQKVTHDLFMPGHLTKSYKPIPLTEEILKANGFVSQIIDDEECLYYKENYTTSVCCRFSDGYWGKGFSIRNNGIVIQGKDIPYVHELQHTLRLCGLNDLADNFKVKGGAE